MTLKIGSNIDSIRAQRGLGDATSSVQKSLERLSSGQRINRASDDSAALAISEQLSSQSKVYTQASRNVNDGISLVSIADSAVSSLTDIVSRIQELAMQSANSIYGNSQRAALDSEAQALKAEYLRVVQTTNFNGINLLDGTIGNGSSIQLGYGSAESILASVGGKIGTGLFQTGSSATASGTPADSAVGDLNGDGNIDLVVAATNGTASVLLGSGDGSFAAIVTYAMETTSTSAISLADINNDGILDLVTTGTGAAAGRFTTRLGAGNGTFGTAVSYQSQTTSSSELNINDINNDGALDIVVSGSSGGTLNTSVFLGSANGTFSSSTTYASHALTQYSTALSDLNKDGRLDLVSFGNNGSLGEIIVRFGTGSGVFGGATTTTLSSGSGSALTIADLNGDGIEDIAASVNSSKDIIVRYGTSAGTFSAGSGTYTTANSSAIDIELKDFNGDGFVDLLELSGTSSGNALGIRYGRGNGSFGTETTFVSAGLIGSSLSIADFNKDGVLDIAAIFTSGVNTKTYLGVTKDGSAPLLDFSLKTSSSALQTIPFLAQKLDQLSSQRGILGSVLSRLAVGAQHVGNLSENLKTANSRIKDVDIAQESSNFLRNSIVQQSATAILAQANQQPLLALKLLQ